MSAAVTGSGGDVVLVFLFLLLDDVVVDFLFSAMVFDAEWILGLVVVVDGDADVVDALLSKLWQCVLRKLGLCPLFQTPHKNLTKLQLN
jgi:hypothetical protein